MGDWASIAPLVVQIPFVLLMAYILDRQARIGIEVLKHLMLEFKSINDRQGERHDKLTDSLLGLIDELSAKANPDKLTSQQIRNIEDYLKAQNKQN